MLFNSIHFIFFLPIIFLGYWLLNKKELRLQNAFLLVASYYFYSCWDWRFVFLLAFSTLLDYYSGIVIHNSSAQKAKKTWLFISIFINLGFLAYFKYYNFFINSFAELLQSFGFNPNFALLNIVLPVGISFYTFHGLSYVIDIYYDRIKPTTNWINYFLFVSFFPLLVAGPIERATHLLPQIERRRNFSYSQSIDGLKQILWGFFKKIVIADNCAQYADMIFNDSHSYSGSTLVLGALFFAFQIYGDFSGYSDIALGTARLFGFELLKNFNFPYFSRDIAEFWRRWHISLSSWFKDYLYIPLGGSKGGNWMKVRNTFIIFIVSGFWHGANWTFIVWGALNAFFIIPSIILKSNRNNLDIVAKGKLLPTVKEFFQIILTFGLTCFAWIFFRADSIHSAVSFIGDIFSRSLFKFPQLPKASLLILLLVGFFMIIEWLGREQNYAIEKLFSRFPSFGKWLIYSVLLFLIGLYMQTNETSFIYFQF